MVNSLFLDLFTNLAVTHLFRQGSNHAPLHVECESEVEIMVKPFKFLSFLTKHHNFKEVGQQSWKANFMESPFRVVQAKFKSVKRALITWSREVFVNIFQRIATLGDVIKVKVMQLEIDLSKNNRTELSRAEAEIKKFLKLEKAYWKQKAGMRWFTHGDNDSRFFHSYVQGRRKNSRVWRFRKNVGD